VVRFGGSSLIERGSRCDAADELTDIGVPTN
jgi:hypothetical protein